MRIEELENKIIPNIESPIYKQNIDIIDEEFVEIKSGNGILVEMVYPKMNLNNSVNKAYLRKKVAEMLYEARKLLPKEYGLKILDAWRALKLQEELFYKYKEDIIKEFHLENSSKEDTEKEISKICFFAYIRCFNGSITCNWWGN